MSSDLNDLPPWSRLLIVLFAGLFLGVGFTWMGGRLPLQSGKSPYTETSVPTLTPSPEVFSPQTETSQQSIPPPAQEQPGWDASGPYVPGQDQTGGIRGLEIGGLAPDFSLKSLDGLDIQLSDFEGEVVLLNFWASWCPPCKEEMPAVQHVYEQYREQGLVILGINYTAVDNLQAARDFVDEMDLTFPILLDESGEVTGRLYRVRGIPTSVWIDREGMIRSIQVGAMPLDLIEQTALQLLNLE